MDEDFCRRKICFNARNLFPRFSEVRADEFLVSRDLDGCKNDNVWREIGRCQWSNKRRFSNKQKNVKVYYFY